MKFYDPSSCEALKTWLSQSGGEIVSSRQVAVVTRDPRYTRQLYRQHVIESDGKILIENALTHVGSPAIKVYWNVLHPTSTSINIETPDRRRDGHWVADIHTIPWLVTSSVSSF